MLEGSIELKQVWFYTCCNSPLGLAYLSVYYTTYCTCKEWAASARGLHNADCCYPKRTQGYGCARDSELLIPTRFTASRSIAYHPLSSAVRQVDILDRAEPCVRQGEISGAPPTYSYTSGSVEICATYTGIGKQPTFPESPNLTDPVIAGLLVVRGLVDSPRFTVVLQMAEMAGSMSNLTKTTLKSVNKLDPTKKKTRLYYEYGW